MTHDVAALLGKLGAARTTDLAGRVDRHTISAWVRRGRVVRAHRGVLVLPERQHEWRVRALAATLATDGVLSHVSALTARGWAPESPVLHVSVAAGRRAARLDRVVVHRVRDVATTWWGPFALSEPAPALVDTWSLVARDPALRGVARAAVIESVREQRVTAEEVLALVAARPGMPGRRDLVRLVGMVAGGSHSELEIWGAEEVLSGAGMPEFVRQHPVRLPGRTVRLDAAVPELQVAVELDGAAFHGSALARESDTRRDVALAALGWVVLRFSYRRLVDDPAGCRREILAVCAARRAQLGAR